MPNFAKDTVTSRRSPRHVMVYGGALALLLVLHQTVTASAYADDQAHADEREALRRMNEQIQELQANVKELEARLNDVKGGASPGAVESSASRAVS